MRFVDVLDCKRLGIDSYASATLVLTIIETSKLCRNFPAFLHEEQLVRAVAIIVEFDSSTVIEWCHEWGAGAPGRDAMVLSASDYTKMTSAQRVAFLRRVVWLN